MITVRMNELLGIESIKSHNFRGYFFAYWEIIKNSYNKELVVK